jgi:ectoine hydroxylase-related dioxygenase (phytanoyl-CoA dioxygenase family)
MVMSNETQPSTDGGVCLPADAGTIVYFDGNFVHWSGLNTSARSRHAYTLHVVETHETTWKPENWLQRDDFVVLDLTDLTN